MIRVKNDYIKTADFEGQMRALISGVKSLKLEKEQSVLWMLSRFERELIRFDDYQGIEIPECLRTENR